MNKSLFVPFEKASQYFYKLFLEKFQEMLHPLCLSFFSFFFQGTEAADERHIVTGLFALFRDPDRTGYYPCITSDCAV